MYAVLVQNVIGFRCGRAVGQFSDNFRLDFTGVLFGDDVLNGCRDEDIDIQNQDFFIGNLFAFFHVTDGISIGPTSQGFFRVKSLFAVPATTAVRNGDDFTTEHFLTKFCSIITGIAVTLNRNGRFAQVDFKRFGCFTDGKIPPRAVASPRPFEPPRARGFPVITPNWL